MKIYLVRGIGVDKNTWSARVQEKIFHAEVTRFRNNYVRPYQEAFCSKYNLRDCAWKKKDFKNAFKFFYKNKITFAWDASGLWLLCVLLQQLQQATELPFPVCLLHLTWQPQVKPRTLQLKGETQNFAATGET